MYTVVDDNGDLYYGTYEACVNFISLHPELTEVYITSE